MTEDEREQLDAIAEELLNDQGQVDVSIHLDDGNVHLAKDYLLGALDKCVEGGSITVERATELYQILDVPQSVKERLRTNYARKQ